MNGIQAGMQGATPQLQVKPVDPNLPICGKLFAINVVTSSGGGQTTPTCTRKQGHYGPCGVAS